MCGIGAVFFFPRWVNCLLIMTRLCLSFHVISKPWFLTGLDVGLDPPFQLSPSTQFQPLSPWIRSQLTKEGFITLDPGTQPQANRTLFWSLHLLKFSLLIPSTTKTTGSLPRDCCNPVLGQNFLLGEVELRLELLMSLWAVMAVPVAPRWQSLPKILPYS